MTIKEQIAAKKLEILTIQKQITLRQGELAVLRVEEQIEAAMAETTQPAQTPAQ